jgi:hypothetical protein
VLVFVVCFSVSVSDVSVTKGNLGIVQRSELGIHCNIRLIIITLLLLSMTFHKKSMLL